MQVIFTNVTLCGQLLSFDDHEILLDSLRYVVAYNITTTSVRMYKLFRGHDCRKVCKHFRRDQDICASVLDCMSRLFSSLSDCTDTDIDVLRTNSMHLLGVFW